MKDTPETSDRPPSKLPNGERNPAYARWYNQVPANKVAAAKRQRRLRESDEGKASVARYNRSAAAKAAKAKYLSGAAHSCGR